MLVQGKEMKVRERSRERENNFLVASEAKERGKEQGLLCFLLDPELFTTTTSIIIIVL